MKLQSLCRRRTYHSPSRQAFKLHAGSELEATEAAVTEADDSGGLGGVDNSMADWEEGGRLFYKLQGLDKAARKEDYYDPEATTKPQSQPNPEPKLEAPTRVARWDIEGLLHDIEECKAVPPPSHPPPRADPPARGRRL